MQLNSLNLSIVMLLITIIGVIIIIYALWFLVSNLQKILIKFVNILPENKRLPFKFLLKIINLVIVLLCIIALLSICGVDVTAIITSLGLTGFAIGLALKDILTNIIAGLLIIIYKPFKEQQYIRINNYCGQVQYIDLPYTHIKNLDNYILIPNSLIFNKEIVVSDKIIS